MIDVDVCDAHHHTGTVLGQTYLLSDLRRDISMVPAIRSSIAVECGSNWLADGPQFMRPVGETRFVAAAIAAEVTAQRSDGDALLGAGYVGYVNFAAGPGASAELLDAHMAAAGGRLRGVRFSAIWDPSFPLPAEMPHSPGMYRDQMVRAGIAMLMPRGLVFDAMVFHPQLGDVLDLAEHLPDLPIVLNHLGGILATGPYAVDRQTEFLNWRSSMAALAECPNISVKIGGLGSPRAGFDWDAIPPTDRIERAVADWSPYINECIEAFGPGRCMFESNFPVDSRLLPYASIWSVFEAISAPLSRPERAELFAGTAARVYQLQGKR